MFSGKYILFFFENIIEKYSFFLVEITLLIIFQATTFQRRSRTYVQNEFGREENAETNNVTSVSKITHHRFVQLCFGL